MYDFKIFQTIANYTVIIWRRDGNRNQTVVRQVGFIAEWQAQQWAEAKIATLSPNPNHSLKGNRTMNITVNAAELRPSTIAAMIADFLDTPSIDNVLTIRKLIDALEINVGEEESIDYLVDAGVTPEQIIEMWETVAE